MNLTPKTNTGPTPKKKKVRLTMKLTEEAINQLDIEMEKFIGNIFAFNLNKELKAKNRKLVKGSGVKLEVTFLTEKK